MDRLLIMKFGGRTSELTRQFLAEFMGTFILLMFGIGSVASAVLGGGTVGKYLSINFGWGIGCALGVYWSAGVSGGHINPAVTLAMAVCGRLPWRKVPVYMIAQFLGAFMASALCFGVYKDLIYNMDGADTLSMKTAGIFSTYPNGNINHGTAFGDQVIGTMLLVGTVCALTDKRNSPPSPGILPVVIGLTVFVIGISFGINCGYGINPARDLIPRLFTAMAGWGTAPFTDSDYWFWIPVAGQFLGGVLGALLYILTIEMHHPNQHRPSLLKSESIPEGEEKSQV